MNSSVSRRRVGQLLVAVAERAVRHEVEVPAMHLVQVGVAALGEGAQQVQRRGRLVVALHQALRIGHARLGVELHAVDDVAAIGRQLDAADGLGRGGARLGELAGHAADLHHRQGGAEGQHHRHLQQHAEGVADVVGGEFREALGAVAALQQEGLALRHVAQRFLEPPRLAGKHQRRIALQALFHRLELGRIRIVRNLRHRLGPPAVRRPLRVHDGPLLLLAHPTWESIISRTLSRRAFRMARKLTCGAGRNNPQILL